MRRILALLMTLVLLCGCTAVAPSPTGTVPIRSEEPVGEQGNLWYLPNETVEAMPVRQLIGSEDGLLLCSEAALKLLSWEELSVKAETTLETGELAYVQVLEEGISIADPGSRTVTLLTDNLAPAGSVSSEAGTNTWLLSPEGDTLYTLSVEGLRAWDLEDGTERELLRCRSMTVLALTGERVYVAAVAETDLMTHWYALDLTRGTLTELADSPMIALQEGLRPQSNGAYIRVKGQTLTQFDPDGGFVSSCTLPEELGTPAWDFVWSDERQGWFFLSNGEAGCRLLFWDPAVPTGGEDINILPEPVPEGEILTQELYDRAAELSQRFDLDIRIADRAIRDYGSYDSEMLTDPEVTAHALDVLEATLSEYPEGFFTQLKYGNRHSVRIELVDALAGKQGHDVSSGTSAFTVRRDRYCMIVLNGQRIRESVIFHEFSHIIDDRMAWEAQFRPEALYSEESWLALQPEGFAYADSYQNISDSVTEFYDSGYFATDYACVSATEDRAVTMEKATMPDRAAFDANPHLMAKLEYYCACIRDSFDTSLWPEVTRWEQLLP